MSPDNAKRLAEAWATGWSSGPSGVEPILAIFTDDCRYEDVPTRTVAEGKEQLAALLTNAFTIMPDHMSSSPQRSYHGCSVRLIHRHAPLPGRS
jgi:hypothetical protein